MRTSTIILVTLLFTTQSHADPSIPAGNPESCMSGPISQFGRYIGDWKIEDSQLSQDGTTWATGNADQWNFVCIGNGTAVQDFWLPNNGSVGTNLRTWNADAGLWDIAWAVNGLPGFAHITAKMQEDGRIVMHYKNPVPEPLRRITFYPPDESGWRWTLELSNDSGQKWFEAYRIKATPLD